MNLHEAIQLIEDDDSIADAEIFIQPPGDGNQSDNDSGDEDNVDINNLPRAQLQAAVDMRAHTITGDEITVSQEVKLTSSYHVSSAQCTQ